MNATFEELAQHSTLREPIWTQQQMFPIKIRLLCNSVQNLRIL